MSRRAGVFLLAGILVVLLATVGLALVAVLPPSRILSIDELRVGMDFYLGGVHFEETYFRDLSQIDAGVRVAFVLTYPDGTSENVSFTFASFLCSDVRAMSVHTDPGVLFRHHCGQDSILVTIF